MNEELINNILQNKKAYIRRFQGKYPAEVIDDAFQDTVIQILNKNNIVEGSNYKAYFQIALRTFIYQNMNKSNRFQSVDVEVEGKIISLYDSSANDVCYYEMIENEQHKQYQLRKMHEHIDDLVGKQKEAVNSVLLQNGSMNDSNFKQAIRKLRSAMGGSLFKTKPYSPKREVRGVVPALTKEAVIDIRNNGRLDKNGKLLNLYYFIDKYNVNRRTITKAFNNHNYKGR